MNEDFEYKQSRVMRHSWSYKNSAAFRCAMHYIADHDWALYCKLIEQEYNEAFGDE